MTTTSDGITIIREQMPEAGAETIEELIVRRWLPLPARERCRQFFTVSERSRARLRSGLSEEDRTRLQEELDSLSPTERARMEREGERQRAEREARLEEAVRYCEGCGALFNDVWPYSRGTVEPCELCCLCVEWCCRCEDAVG